MSDECQSFRDAIAKLAQKKPRSDGKILTVREYADPVDPITGKNDEGTIYEFTYVNPENAHNGNSSHGNYTVYSDGKDEIYELNK